jgi:hypothetical protein
MSVTRKGGGAGALIYTICTYVDMMTGFLEFEDADSNEESEANFETNHSEL